MISAISGGGPSPSGPLAGSNSPTGGGGPATGQNLAAGTDLASDQTSNQSSPQENGSSSFSELLAQVFGGGQSDVSSDDDMLGDDDMLSAVAVGVAPSPPGAVASGTNGTGTATSSVGGASAAGGSSALSALFAEISANWSSGNTQTGGNGFVIPSVSDDDLLASSNADISLPTTSSGASAAGSDDSLSTDDTLALEAEEAMSPGSTDDALAMDDNMLATGSNAAIAAQTANVASNTSPAGWEDMAAYTKLFL